MSAASDKARFYLERHAPALNAYARQKIFSPEEIHSITAKRSHFEHVLAARGSKPSDYARYAEYEINLSTLLKKRCQRLGVKGVKGYSGQRTVFFILERGTKKFAGDVGLWMQYIRYCQSEHASKKLAVVFTGLLRLRPREWGLWVVAAKWYAEEQGDMRTARGYLQRGLRYCKDERKFWLEYAKLEMVYLAKLAARRKILGVGEERKAESAEEADENMIPLPTITAADVDPDAGKELEGVDAAVLQKLADAPAFTGAIPVAIFDAAMKQFGNNAEVAEDFFELVAKFDTVPSATKVLRHILTHLQNAAPNSPEAIVCEARMLVFGIDAVSAEFPAALGTALGEIKTAIAALPEKQKAVLAQKAVLMLVPYLSRKSDGAEIDEDVQTVLVASTNRYLSIMSGMPTKSRIAKVLVGRFKDEGRLGGEEISEAVGSVKGQS
ncbi:U3 snoRNP protein [Friedmanniomyces endolithicus]|nr:U3 snoRNP protein [Friedmanniomyces endolithicus]